jgi:hypothetical protein
VFYLEDTVAQSRQINYVLWEEKQKKIRRLASDLSVTNDAAKASALPLCDAGGARSRERSRNRNAASQAADAARCLNTVSARSLGLVHRFVGRLDESLGVHVIELGA